MHMMLGRYNFFIISVILIMIERARALYVLVIINGRCRRVGFVGIAELGWVA